MMVKLILILLLIYFTSCASPKTEPEQPILACCGTEFIIPESELAEQIQRGRKGDPLAARRVYFHYLSGMNQTGRAQEWLQEMAEHGDAHSMYLLGYNWLATHGRGQNLEPTIEWWKKAVEAGCPIAGEELAFLYSNELKDQAKAKAWQDRSISMPSSINPYCNIDKSNAPFQGSK